MFWGRLGDIKFLDGAVFGAFLASILYLSIFMVADITDGQVYHEYVTSMLVTIATLGAASAAVYVSRIQIRQANDQENGRLQKSTRAAVAMLPMALSNMSEACRINMQRNFSVNDLLFVDKQVNEFATLDSETMSILKECIQYGDEYSQGRIASMIRTYQVLRARNEHIMSNGHIEPGQNNVGADHERIGDVLNWAALHAVVDNAYAYARGEVGTIPRVWDGDLVRSAMMSSGIDIEEFPNLIALYHSRLERGKLEMFPEGRGNSN